MRPQACSAASAKSCGAGVLATSLNFWLPYFLYTATRLAPGALAMSRVRSWGKAGQGPLVCPPHPACQALHERKGYQTPRESRRVSHLGAGQHLGLRVPRVALEGVGEAGRDVHGGVGDVHGRARHQGRLVLEHRVVHQGQLHQVARDQARLPLRVAGLRGRARVGGVGRDAGWVTPCGWVPAQRPSP